MITYLLELQFAVEKAQGLLITNNNRLFPNIENFKSLSFTSDVGVAEVAAQMMAVTGPAKEMDLTLPRVSCAVVGCLLRQCH